MYNIRRDIPTYGLSHSLFLCELIIQPADIRITSERLLGVCGSSAKIRPRIAVSFYLKSRDDFSIPSVLRLIARARSTLASLSLGEETSDYRVGSSSKNKTRDCQILSLFVQFYFLSCDFTSIKNIRFNWVKICSRLISAVIVISRVRHYGEF